MRVFDVMAWVIVVLGTVKAIYYVVMLATGPARARRTGRGAPREAWQEISGAVLGIVSGIIFLTVNSMSHVRWLLLVPMVAVLVIDQVLRYRDRYRAPAEPA
jgi:hypothetical protein